MSTATTLLTAQEFQILPDNGQFTELVKGVVIEMPPPTPRHGQICGKLSRHLGNFAEEHNLGHVVTNDAGIITERSPDTVRGADVAFYSFQRVPPGEMPIGYIDIAPDLVIEVRSPSDRWRMINKKVAEYLEAGVALVCVLDEQAEIAYLSALDQPPRLLTADGELDFSEVLPGFRVPLRRFFE